MPTALASVRTVIFDMGDVMYDATAWRRWLHRWLQEKAGLELTYRELFALWEEQFLSRIHTGALAYRAGFQLFLNELCLSPAVQEALLAINWQKKSELEAQAQVFAEVPPTLAALKGIGLTTCVLTDTELPEAAVRQLLQDRLGISHLIDVVVSSADTGCRKPDPEAYYACFARTQTPRENCVFVAHDEDELTGARQIDLLTIAFNYQEPVTADCKIAHFGELVSLLSLRPNFFSTP